MGHFYFDESIQEKAGFIIGAFVYSNGDLTPPVYAALTEAGLKPGVDEFKSGARMVTNPAQDMVRKLLRSILQHLHVGLVVIPSSCRDTLGTEAITGLDKIIRANALTNGAHHVFIDEGIEVDQALLDAFHINIGVHCKFNLNQDSKQIGGIQMADLAAHSMGVMLLEHLGHLKKMVKAGENSGYDPDLDMELGFELWASLRYAFFKAPQPIPGPEDPLGDLMFDVTNYGLYIAPTCDDALQKAASERFGECYLGCIH